QFYHLPAQGRAAATRDGRRAESRILMSLEEFRTFRERMNERSLAADTLDIKRFFALDSRVYESGAPPTRTKELIGLVASLVLRCDDCVTYHLVRCAEEGVSDEEVLETLSVGLIVGGSIVIPH